MTCIDGEQMSHERGKRACISVAIGGNKRRQDFHASAIGKLRARKARLIAFYPGRHVARHRVLPSAEPEQHDAGLMRTCLFEQAVDRAEVELPCDGLEQFPGRRRQDVLSPSLANSGQNCCRYLRSAAVELPSSPPRTRNGAPSTMSCWVVLLARKCGASSAAIAPVAAASISAGSSLLRSALGVRTYPANRPARICRNRRCCTSRSGTASTSGAPLR
jgi:hypothetical protein